MREGGSCTEPCADALEAMPTTLVATIAPADTTATKRETDERALRFFTIPPTEISSYEKYIDYRAENQALSDTAPSPHSSIFIRIT